MNESQAAVIAAAIAAALSAASLIVTILIERSRAASVRTGETTAWLRDSLYQVVHDALDSSFEISSASREGRRLRAAAASQELLQLELDRAHQAHETLIECLTKMRLLAPAALVQAGELLHDVHHELVNHAFFLDEDVDAWRSARESGRSSREMFISGARIPLGLDGSAVPIGAKAQSGWTLAAPQSPSGSAARGRHPTKS
ncbi:hypothetical protein [Luteipulveratus flavus]|uniref:Secreted protein n=1 Tax=Luteipulveratus flavus TaxID=3031728 RepID=A0ABT6CB29_9MICO|nr:hypothetical protein [Luteipulveratus sp. YIM 133296]MDF8265738.1 hypothetical protein [Luteipulveratus sp. YIM 133296]